MAFDRAVQRLRDRRAFDLFLLLALVATVAVAAEQRVLETFRIASRSMDPTLEVGDRLLAYSIRVFRATVEVGDLVTFDPPAPYASPIPVVKRVVALAGDSVSVENGMLFVNGFARDEPYVRNEPARYTLPAYRVPPESVFLLGDNRNASEDSTTYGAVPLRRLRQVVLLRYEPWGRRCSFARSLPLFPACLADASA